MPHLVSSVGWIIFSIELGIFAVSTWASCLMMVEAARHTGLYSTPAVTERVPGATLQLAGSSMWYAEAKAARASGITGVSFIGEGAASVGDSAARQLTMALRTSRVLASPALAAPGGAPSFASLLAISHALPLVTTPIGARGLLASRSPGAVSIVKTALEFATAVAQLLTNSTAWTIQRNTAATHAQRHLGERAVVSTLRQSVASAASALHLGA